MNANRKSNLIASPLLSAVPRQAASVRPLLSLPQVLARRRGEIIERFVGEIRRRSLGPPDASEPTLAGNIPAFLDELIGGLRSLSRAEPAPDGWDEPPSSARAHGRSRSSGGYDLPVVVQEYGILWKCLLGTVRDAGASATFQELEALGDRLAAGVTAAVAEYARHREEESRAQRAALDRLSLGQRYVAEAGQLLASSLDTTETLRRVTDLAVPALADWCVVGLLHEGRFPLRCVAHAHVNPDQSELLRAFAASYCPDPSAPGPAVQVILTGQPALLPQVPPDGVDGAEGVAPAFLERLRPFRKLGMESLIIAPLVTQGRVNGLVFFAHGESGRRYDSIDLEMATALAPRIAFALQNAELYAHAQQAVRAREDILAVVSHDLKDPLSVVQVGANLMERELATPTPDLTRLRKRVDAIRRASAGIEKLTSGLLDLARIDADQLDIRPVAIDAGALLQQAFEVAQPLAEQKAICLLKEVPRDGTVRCDRDRMLQVLSNLLGNAIKFTPERGTVLLSADVAGDDARFAVVDSGPGIAREQLPFVFERFWRAPGSRQKGNGLGLAIARGIVEAHGGRLRVESEIGQGSTFELVIPRGAGGE